MGNDTDLAALHSVLEAIAMVDKQKRLTVGNGSGHAQLDCGRPGRRGRKRVRRSRAIGRSKRYTRVAEMIFEKAVVAAGHQAGKGKGSLRRRRARRQRYRAVRTEPFGKAQMERLPVRV